MFRLTITRYLPIIIRLGCVNLLQGRSIGPPPSQSGHGVNKLYIVQILHCTGPPDPTAQILSMLSW